MFCADTGCRCKKLVNARKQFTIKQAPQILHVHLKRFTPTGKKISGQIQYPEYLDLGPYMSEDAIDVSPSDLGVRVVADCALDPCRRHQSIVSMLWFAMLEADLTPVTTLLTFGPPTETGTT